VDAPDGPSTTLHSPFSFLVSLFVSLVLRDTAAGGVEAWRDCTTSLFPCGLSPADSAPAPLLPSLLSSLLSSPLVALLSLLRMK
jgi:hypothetical protein